MLTGLEETDIDEIIASEPVDKLGHGASGVVAKKIYRGKEYAVKSQKLDDNIRPEIFDLELTICLVLTADETTRRYVPFTFGGKRTATHGYIVMEVIDGITIRDLFKNRHVTPEETLFLKEKLYDAISKIHQKNILHLDIQNPGNVFILLDNNNIYDIVLIDFNNGFFTDIARPWSEVINAKVEPGYFTTNLKHINEYIESKIWSSSNASNIIEIRKVPRKIRVYETLPELRTDQIAILARCEEELREMETQYKDALAASYNSREAEWNIQAETRNRKFINGRLTILKKTIINLTMDNELFIEKTDHATLFPEISTLFESIFQEGRRAKQTYEESLNKALNTTIEVVSELFRIYNEKLAEGDEKETILKELKEVFPRVAESYTKTLDFSMPKLFWGGTKLKRTKIQMKTKKKKSKRNTKSRRIRH